MRRSSRTAFRGDGPFAGRLIRLAASTLVGFSFFANPSRADFCGTTRDFIEGHIFSHFSTEDLVFAGASRSEEKSVDVFGTFSINMIADSNAVPFMAQLKLSKVFVAHVFHGNKKLEGHYIIFMHIEGCEDWGCKLNEISLEKVKKDISRLNLSSDAETNREEMFASMIPSPPYRLYFLRRYNPNGLISLDHAKPIWTYLSDTFGLQFYERHCGTFEIENMPQNIEVQKRLGVIEKSSH